MPDKPNSVMNDRPEPAILYKYPPNDLIWAELTDRIVEGTSAPGGSLEIALKTEFGPKGGSNPLDVGPWLRIRAASSPDFEHFVQHIALNFGRDEFGSEHRQLRALRLSGIIRAAYESLKAEEEAGQ